MVCQSSPKNIAALQTDKSGKNKKTNNRLMEIDTENRRIEAMKQRKSMMR
jgi:hypothetical protein